MQNQRINIISDSHNNLNIMSTQISVVPEAEYIKLFIIIHNYKI